MATSSRLTFLSYGLLLFNLILAGFAVLGMQGTNIAHNEGEVLGVRSVPIFSPNLIISDETFFSTRAFGSVGDVQNFLEMANSPLKNYREKGQNASYWIFAAARGQTSSKSGVVPQLNPGLIIAYLEKEQGLISSQNYDVYTDKNNKIRSAMGYGCPDAKLCDSKYYGFVNQVNWAAYQLQYNYNIIKNGSKSAFPYNLNTTITTLDEYNVFLTNAATAANYRYTPHTYWGNYNLWKMITVNGWGTDATKYTYQEIDAANLPNKGQKTQKPTSTVTNVSEEEGFKLVRREYYLGQDNKEIEKLQVFLRQKKFFMNRDITGLYGVVTDKALQNYRQENGIIIREFSKMDKQVCVKTFNKDFKSNEQSEEIKVLQKCLMEIRYFDWPLATGTFGQITREGQMAARKAFNLNNSQPKEEIEDKKDQDNEQNKDNSCQNLKNQSFQNGENSQRVKDLQICMRQEGFFNFSGGNTGLFGQITASSLANWKNSNKPNPQTQPTNQPNYSFNCSDLKKQKWTIGENGTRVVALQACMRREGVFNFSGGNTGNFGQVTANSLVKWRGYL